VKYRRLDRDELQKLEREFVDFLVINGITADEWVQLKENKPYDAGIIVDQFCDVVWESTLRKISYLDMQDDTYNYYFKCDPDKIHLIRTGHYQNNNSDSSTDLALKVQRQSKPYADNREEELFKMIENGCSISDGQIYDSLEER
jgi:hypothetical protein